VATLGEVLHALPVKMSVVAGATGLGREVRRVIRARPSTELALPVGAGDLIIYEAPHPDPRAEEAVNRAFSSLANAGVAGIICDVRSCSGLGGTAESCKAPLLVCPPAVDFETLEAMLERAIDVQTSRLDVQQVELQRELMNLAHSGATSSMVLERLVEKTGKSGLLQRDDARIEEARLAPGIEPGDLKQAVHASDLAVERWIHETADATVANLLYLELNGHNLVRLVAPLWVAGRVHRWLSLLARPSELRVRDRVGLLAAARAMTTSTPMTAEPEVARLLRGCASVAAVVMRAPSAQSEALAAAAQRRIDPGRAVLTTGQNDVRLWLAYESADDWQHFVTEWHAELTDKFGTVSIGHVVRKGVGAQDANYAIVQAAEALLIGDRLFGPGHLTSSAEAQLASFLTGYDQLELRALYERAVGKLVSEDSKREGDLVNTLEVYCQTFATQRTAERLGVHRNTVLYRIKRIENITAADLADGPTRLMFQLGLLAGRVMRKLTPAPVLSGVAA
jgi:hypothetical protein